MSAEHKLVSTISRIEYPFGYLSEFAENGESLEVQLGADDMKEISEGQTIWQRFAESRMEKAFKGSSHHIDSDWVIRR